MNGCFDEPGKHSVWTRSITGSWTRLFIESQHLLGLGSWQKGWEDHQLMRTFLQCMYIAHLVLGHVLNLREGGSCAVRHVLKYSIFCHLIDRSTPYIAELCCDPIQVTTTSLSIQ